MMVSFPQLVEKIEQSTHVVPFPTRLQTAGSHVYISSPQLDEKIEQLVHVFPVSSTSLHFIGGQAMVSFPQLS